MSVSRPISHSHIYREYRSIDGSDWRMLRRFYEEYEAQIKHLEFEEYFELLLIYSNALYELGLYEKHLRTVDNIIETSMSYNVKFFNGVDVFQDTLFKKASSYFHLYELEKSEYILREIIRIDPYDEKAADLLKNTLRKMRSPLARRSRAVAMSLFLLSAAIICLEMLAVRPFFEDDVHAVEYTRTGIFLLGLIVLAGGELLHRYRCEREVDGFVQVLQQRK